MVSRKYEHAVIAVDIVMFTIHDEKLKALLIKMKKKPYTRSWAVPGGLIRAEESVDQAAQRILAEKAGIKDVYLEQLYTFGRVDRDPFGRVVSVAYFALIPKDRYTIQTTEEYSDIDWFPVVKLPHLAYDHTDIIRVAVKRLQAKLGYTNIVYSLLPREFTLSELQKTYEIILGHRLDKRNFRKKLLTLDLVTRTGKKVWGSAHRPADLYRFARRSPQNVQIL